MRDGAELLVEELRPPLPTDDVDAIVSLVTRSLSEPYLANLLRGKWLDRADVAVIRGRIDQRLVGTAWVGWGRRLPDIGVMGGVATQRECQRRGIAGILVRRAIETFDREAGRMLFLATTSPYARKIYERLGFSAVVGNLLCRFTRGARLREGFAPGQPVNARAADFGDAGA